MGAVRDGERFDGVLNLTLDAAERGARIEPGELGMVRRALAAVREAPADEVDARAAETERLIAGIAGGGG